MKRILPIIIFLIAVTLSVTAQKKNAKTTAKPKTAVVLQEEDYTQWVENPVCKVVVLDSVVVPLSNVVQNIPLPQHMGHFFSDSDTGNLTYENDFGNLRYFSAKDKKGHFHIYQSMLLGTKWSNASEVKVNGTFTDLTNPFPMPDGQTLILSARSEDSEPYSLYMTTYDSESEAYRTPTRLPYPFVSDDADDLYFIEDDADSLAWLATTRRQPAEKVCIYTMRVSQPWTYYDTEETAGYKLKNFAEIQSIADTWTSSEQRKLMLAEAHESLANAVVTTKKVVNDSPIAKEMAHLKEIKHQLEVYRKLYHNTPADQRAPLAKTITELESDVQKSINTIKQLRCSTK